MDDHLICHDAHSRVFSTSIPHRIPNRSETMKRVSESRGDFGLFFPEIGSISAVLLRLPSFITELTGSRLSVSGKVYRGFEHVKCIEKGYDSLHRRYCWLQQWNRCSAAQIYPTQMWLRMHHSRLTVMCRLLWMRIRRAFPTSSTAFPGAKETSTTNQRRPALREAARRVTDSRWRTAMEFTSTCSSVH